MPDQDDTAGTDADTDADGDQGLAAERLERALEQIAASAHRAAASGRSQAGEAMMDPDRTGEVASRLDALIAELRTALDRD